MSSPLEKMSKSVVLTGYGGYDKIQTRDVELPVELGPKEVRVRNSTFGVNFADLYTLKGLFEHPTPFVMGLESFGKVLEVGTDVKDIKIGDRVVCYKWTGGLFSKIIQIDSDNCFVIPENMTNLHAIGLPANYLTAYIIIFKIAKLKAGQSILIHSCAGGVGWAATQLAKLVGNIDIFGTTSENKVKFVKENGVKHPMTYDTYISSMNQIIPDGKVDCIIDSIGGNNFATSQKLLKPLGQVILTGCSSLIEGSKKFTDSEKEALGSSASTDMMRLVVGNQGVYGFHLGLLMDQCPELIHDCMKHLIQLFNDSSILPRISNVWPFEKAAEAIEDLEKRKNIGKVVLTI